MTKYEIGWNEFHYMEVEANSIAEAEEVLYKLVNARTKSVTTYQGITGGIDVWGIEPDIEVSDSLIFFYDTEAFHYEVLNDD